MSATNMSRSFNASYLNAHLLKLETIQSWTHLILALSMRPPSTKSSLDTSNGSFPMEGLISRYLSCQCQGSGHSQGNDTLLEARGSLATWPIFSRGPSDFDLMSLITHPYRNKTLTGQDLSMAISRNIYHLVS